MLLYCGNIRQANDFIKEQKQFMVKDFDVTVVKGVPYFTINLYQNGEKVRDFDYEFSIVQRTSDIIDTEKIRTDMKAEKVMPFFMNGSLKFGMMFSDKGMEKVVEEVKDEEPTKQTTAATPVVEEPKAEEPKVVDIKETVEVATKEEEKKEPEPVTFKLDADTEVTQIGEDEIVEKTVHEPEFKAEETTEEPKKRGRGRKKAKK